MTEYFNCKDIALTFKSLFEVKEDEYEEKFNETINKYKQQCFP